jgi:benzylsuccinate CoA-transferase BbsF subunit
MGYEDGGPYKAGPAYCDLISGINAAAAVLTALWHRQQTGRGQYLDQSQAESSTTLAGDAALGYQLSGRLPKRLGNGHPWKAPHGCYRCAGEDNWLVIAVGTDDEWRALLGAIGSPAWGSDSRFADPVGRWRHQQDLDALITEWTIRHDHLEAMRLLQSAGVPAAAVLKNSELLADPHLKARAYFVGIEHPEAGRHLYAGAGIRFSRSPVFHLPAPILGQHNDFVLKDLLDLSEAENRELKARQVIGTVPLV